MKKPPSSLRTLRQLRGLSLTDLGEAVDKSPQHLREVEVGNRKAAPDTLRAILAALDAMPQPDSDLELLHDLEQPLDVLWAEAQQIHEGIDAAAQRIGAGEDVELHLRFVAHAVGRQRAILAALRTRVQSTRPS